MFVPYATRERLAAAADVTWAAWLDGELDLAIEQGSRAVDKLCRRGDETRPAFAPWTGTIEFDWPTDANRSSYRYWLGPHSLLTTETVTSGGDDVTTAALGYPAQYGPPYEALDLDQADSFTYTTATGIGQRSLAVAGTWCATPINELTMATWTLTGSISSGDVSADLLAVLGVGSQIRIGTERMIVTDRAWAATGDSDTLTASMNDTSVTVADGAAYVRGDTLILDSERVRVRDVVGNTLVVQRAVDGSALAAHTAAPIYALRTCGIARGALGTTAAGHTAGDPVYVYRYPAIVEQLAVAYALDQRAQETANYARAKTVGDGSPLKVLEDRVLGAYGRVLTGAA